MDAVARTCYCEPCCKQADAEHILRPKVLPCFHMLLLSTTPPASGCHQGSHCSKIVYPPFPTQILSRAISLSQQCGRNLYIQFIVSLGNVSLRKGPESSSMQ